jgi:hypothetical protein
MRWITLSATLRREMRARFRHAEDGGARSDACAFFDLRIEAKLRIGERMCAQRPVRRTIISARRRSRSLLLLGHARLGGHVALRGVLLSARTDRIDEGIGSFAFIATRYITTPRSATRVDARRVAGGCRIHDDRLADGFEQRRSVNESL